MKVACLPFNSAEFLDKINTEWQCENFVRNHLSTLGAEFGIKRIIEGDKCLELQFWVIETKLGYRDLRKRFLRGAPLYIIYEGYHQHNPEIIFELIDFLNDKDRLRQAPYHETHKELVIFVGIEDSVNIQHLISNLNEYDVIVYSPEAFFLENTLIHIYDYFKQSLFS